MEIRKQIADMIREMRREPEGLDIEVKTRPAVNRWLERGFVDHVDQISVAVCTVADIDRRIDAMCDRYLVERDDIFVSSCVVQAPYDDCVEDGIELMVTVREDDVEMFERISDIHWKWTNAKNRQKHRYVVESGEERVFIRCVDPWIALLVEGEFRDVEEARSIAEDIANKLNSVPSCR